MVDLTKKYCLTCGHVDHHKSKAHGSFAIEVTLWIVFALIAAESSGWVLLVPLIYSLSRTFSKTKVCSKCMSDKIIPTDSPIAIKALATDTPTENT